MGMRASEVSTSSVVEREGLDQGEGGAAVRPSACTSAPMSDLARARLRAALQEHAGLSSRL